MNFFKKHRWGNKVIGTNIVILHKNIDMRKENFDKLSEALKRYTDAEEAYSRACCTDDEQLQYDTGSEMNAYCDLLTVAVQQVLNDEIDNIQ